MRSLLLVALAMLCAASPGDDLYAFLDCVYQCEQVHCYDNPLYHLIEQEHRDELLANNPNYEFHYYNPWWTFSPQPLPKHLQVLGWDCQSNCDYECQRLVTRLRKENKQEIYQFHGKWPFYRVYGIQELVSMVFSFGNFYVHLLGFFQLAKYAYKNGVSYTFFNILLVNLITMCAWIASTVFHIRDVELTEKLDYYFAGLTVLSLCHSIFARLFGLHQSSKFLGRLVWGGACAAAYAWHIHRLETDWLYTYNMQANITVGILQNVGLYFLVYGIYTKFYELEKKHNTVDLAHLQYINFKRMILPSFYLRSPKLYLLYPLLLSTIVVIGMLLEIFDFAPIFDLVDAHSLWHLVTIFPAYLGWYDWMLWDLDTNVGEKEKVKSE